MVHATIFDSMTRVGELRFELGVNLGVWLPGASRPMRPGKRIPDDVRTLARQLGLSVQDDAPSTNLLRILALIALSRLDGEDSLALELLASRGWPNRPAYSLGNEMYSHFLHVKSSGALCWVGAHEAPMELVKPLIEFQCDHAGQACIKHGPYRLNPAYGVVRSGDALRLFAYSGQGDPHGEIRVPETIDEVFEHAGLFIGDGKEAAALGLYYLARDKPASSAAIGELQLRTAQAQMQLGLVGESAHTARGLERMARRRDHRLLGLEALHVQALTARQRKDPAAALELDRAALQVLDRLTLDRRRRLMISSELKRNLGISTFTLVFQEARLRGACFLSSGGARTDRRWGRAVRLLREARREADEADDKIASAHATMRIAQLRLLQHARTAAEEREIVDAADLIPVLSIPARLIWERIVATEALLRARGSAVDVPLSKLLRCAEDDARRGYRHQLGLVHETLRCAGQPADALLLQHLPLSRHSSP